MNSVFCVFSTSTKELIGIYSCAANAEAVLKFLNGGSKLEYYKEERPIDPSVYMAPEKLREILN